MHHYTWKFQAFHHALEYLLEYFVCTIAHMPPVLLMLVSQRGHTQSGIFTHHVTPAISYLFICVKKGKRKISAYEEV